MRKQSICIVSFILAVFCMLLFLQYETINQQRFPLGTTTRFEINTSESVTDKSTLINELDDIANKNNNLIVKTVSDSEDISGTLNMVVFGDAYNGDRDIVLEDDRIRWLDSSMAGVLIASSNMGTRPLNGIYAVVDEGSIRQDIDNWAIENNIEISWYKNPSVVRNLYDYLILNGLGNTVISLYLLLMITFVSWLVLHAKSRAVRLCAGLSKVKICTEDTISIMLMVGTGFVLGWIGVLLYISFTNCMAQIILVFLSSLLYLLLVFLSITCTVFIFGFIVRPRASHVVERKIPLKQMNLLSWIIKGMSILVALLVIPTTMTSAYAYHQLSNEYAMWKGYADNVQISLRDINSMEKEDVLPNVEAFFKEMENEGNLRISFVVDGAIELSQEEMGGYDHIILVDKAWVESSNVGIGVDGEGGRIDVIDIDSVSPALEELLNAQMPLWTRSGNSHDEGIRYCEFTGQKFLAISPSPINGSQTVQATNPLIILVDNPSEILKVKGFTLYAASTGNVVFADKNQLAKCIEKYQLSPFVRSIDNTADAAMELAQQFGRDAFNRILSCVAIILTVSVTGVITARMWTHENNKRIFILHSFGIKYSSLISMVMKKEICLVLGVIVGGSIISKIVAYSNVAFLILALVLVLLAYIIGGFVSYYLCMKEAFRNTCHRYY